MTEAMSIPFPQQTQAPAAPGAETWIDCKTAAKLCGESEGNLRRKAALFWSKQVPPLARWNDWTTGKKAFWEISSNADPLFTPGGISRPAPTPPIAGMGPQSKKLLEQAGEKMRILNEWARYVSAAMVLGVGKHEATDRFLHELAVKEHEAGNKEFSLSPRTLYNWERSRRIGAQALFDGRSNRSKAKVEAKAGDPFFSYLKSLYMTKRQRKAAVCYDRAVDKALEMGWEVCSERTARRFLKSIDPAEVIFHREGPKAFNDKVCPDILRQYDTLEVNEVWNADHHEFDVLVKVGERLNTKTGELEPILKRPWLTAWQDVRSRKIVGWIISDADPCTDSILYAFRLAVKEHGVPRTAYTDNGKDFDSRIFTGMSKSERRKAIMWRKRKLHVEHNQKLLGGIYAWCGIEHIHAWKYHGQSKPIERFFNTLADRFSREWDTYCGRSPLHKPEDLIDNIKAGKSPTLEEFRDVFAVWLEKDYHGRVHQGEGMDVTPDQAYTDFAHAPKRVIAEADLEVMCQQRLGGKEGYTVTKDGICHKGLHYAGRGELVRLLGQKVWIRLRETIDFVSVWDDQDNPIAVVPLKERVGFHARRDILTAAIKEKRQDIRKIKDAWEPRLRIHETTAERINRIQAETPKPRAASSESPPPQNFSPVRSEFEDRLRVLHEMEQQTETSLRIAAGAESMSASSSAVFKAAEAAFGVNDEF